MLLHSYTHLLHVEFHLSLELSSDLSEQCSSCGLKPIFNANDTSKTRNTGIILLKSIMGGGRRYLKKVGASKKMVIIREILL